jgi:hypothetical protein
MWCNLSEHKKLKSSDIFNAISYLQGTLKNGMHCTNSRTEHDVK